MPPPTANLSDEEVHKLVATLTSEWVKQLITLAIGIIVLSVTFLKDIVKGPVVEPRWLIGSWVAFGFATILGLVFHQSVVGGLWKTQKADIYETSRRAVGAIQNLLFF